eukprot:551947_1
MAEQKEAPKVVARWTFNAKFGMTKEACTSITTWNKTIGSKAMMDGLKWSKEDIANRVSLQQGSIGAIEQRFEMNIKFDKISDLDLFFCAIPGSEHVKWGKQHANYIVGNTKWEIYRTKPIQ